MRKNELMAALIFGGSNAEVEPVTITKNGVTQVPEGKAYNPITVNVSFTPPNSLYYRGNEFVDDTGGWNQFGTGTLTKNADYMQALAGDSKTVGAITQKKFLLDGVSGIKVKFNNSTAVYAEAHLQLYTSRDAAAAPIYDIMLERMTSAVVERTADISSVTGEYYIAVAAYSSYGTRYVNFYEVSTIMAE